MQVVDSYGCKTGTYYVIASDANNGKDVAYGPFFEPEVAQKEAEAKLRSGFKNAMVTLVQSHFRIASQVVEVVNGQQ